jgi:hypothetical protein
MICPVPVGSWPPTAPEKSTGDEEGGDERVSGGATNNKAIAELRSIHATLTEFLRRGREAAHRDMVEVSPGIWIHKDFKDLSETVKWLNAMLP